MKYSKIIVKISLVMIFGGLIVSGIGYFMGGTKGVVKSKFVNINVGSKDHIVENKELGDFKNLKLDVSLDYVEIIKSDKNKIELNYDENLEKVDYKIENNTLVVNQKSLYENKVGINLDLSGIKSNPSYMTLYIKENEMLENITVNFKDTDLKINEINSNTMDVKVNYGDVSISNLSSNNVKIDMKDGDISLKNSSIANDCELLNSYGSVTVLDSNFGSFRSSLNDGNVNLENSKSNKINIKNSYGDVMSYNLESNDLKVYCNDGNIDLDGNILGMIDIENKYGNVDLNLYENEENYNYFVKNSYGDIYINNQSIKDAINKDRGSDNTINISSNDGDIDIKFK